MRLVQRAQEKEMLVLRLIMVVVLLFAALFTLSARAQAYDDRPIPYSMDGRPGVWFPLPEARLVLQHELERGDLLARVQLTSDALSIARTEIDLHRSAKASAVAALAGVREELLQTRSRLSEANAWYRDPLLWGGVGFVAGTVLVTVIALAVGGAL